jgi:hypothetical protein
LRIKEQGTYLILHEHDGDDELELKADSSMSVSFKQYETPPSH